MNYRRFIINGTALSEPGTMGGNSKIALELARGLAAQHETHLIVPATKRATVDDAIGRPNGLVVHTIEPFYGSDMRHPIASTRHYTRELRKILTALGAGKEDAFYSASDFHVDTLPALRLKKEFGFFWIAVQFLFVPGVAENLIHRYRFPAAKYALVWCYSNGLFRLARQRADAFVITNHSDLIHFTAGFRPRVFPFYGGVNVDQIPNAVTERTRDVIFCSRLHPQKGLDGFLDVWKLVTDRLPKVRLTVIGNGAESYERKLRDKAKRLGIDRSIDWLGYVNNEAKYAIYAQAHVMVHPTVFDNNGMVAAEALCSGLPVVMYDLPALRNLYTDGCLKVPFGDKTAFANVLVELLSDPARRATVAPTPVQKDALRTRWNWPSRVAEFETWLGGL